MKIDSIDCFSLTWAYPKPIYDARSAIHKKTALLIKINLDNGIFGWGEVACFGGVAHAAETLIKDNILPLIEGKNAMPRDILALLKAKTAHYGQRGIVVSAISGIEIALWDAVGKSLKTPVAHMLGSALKPIRVYAATGYYTADNTEADIISLKGQIEAIEQNQFSGMKIKIGKYGIKDDARRAAIARKHIGKDQLLIVDANNSYNPRTAIAASNLFVDSNVYFIEEPIEFNQSEQSLYVKQHSSVPIAGYELDSTFQGFAPYIDNQSVDFIQPDAIWSGGIIECLMISDHAKRNLIPVIPHNFSTIISLAANYHMLCAANNGDLLEFEQTGTPFVNGLVKHKHHSICDGSLIFEEVPGLGVDIDEKLLASYLSQRER